MRPKRSNFRIKLTKQFWLFFFAIFGFLVVFVISVAGGLRFFLPYLPELTGFPFGTKTYLLVFQNNAELRPAGGFISSFATLQFSWGLPTKFEIEDVYGSIDDHPYQEGPYPMTKLLQNEWYKGYSFRDGNFDANFAHSAAELVRLYQLTRPQQKIDGVIAINFSVLQKLVAALGQIEVNGQILDGDNLFEAITASVNDVDRHNEKALAERKSIFKPLAYSLIYKLISNPFLTRTASDVITASFTEKEIQLYLFNSSWLARDLNRLGWTGEWPQEVSGDFLAVVEANLGGMKSNRYIQRDITYHLRISEENLAQKTPLEATLTTSLHHFGIENIPLSGPYTGYFRFYSQPDEQNPQSEIVKLQPGQSTEIVKRYNIPFSVLEKVNEDWLYQLAIPKQSGTLSDHYTVIIELPRGYLAKSVEGFESRENFAYFQGQLNRDLKLAFQILPDQTPPRLVLQTNQRLNQINLHFNEDLNQDYAADPFSYEIRDLDIINSSQTDQLKIKKVETTSKDITLYLSGQTQQPEERYGVTLKNLRDTHGNILTQREITVVQRVK